MNSGVNYPKQWLIDWFNRVSGGSGANVTQETALSLAAVQRCVTVISDSVATMPLRLYSEVNGVKQVESAHPLTALINEPNPMQSRFDWIKWAAAQLTISGNAYLYIRRADAGMMLEPIHHERVKQITLSPDLVPSYHIEGFDKAVLGLDLLHFKGLPTSSGMKGRNPIQMHAESLGVTLGAQRASAKFYGKDAALKFAIKWAGPDPGKEKSDKLKESFDRVQTGGDSTVVIPNGAALEQLNLTPQEAEFLMTRRYGVEDIARIFGVPAYMIGADTQGIKSSVEQQAQDFYVQTILPIVTMMEQELRRKLVPENQKATHYFKFIFNSLLRADAKTRAEVYNMGIRGGWKTPNQARALEDENPMEGGDTTYTESNLVPSDMMRDWIQSKIDAAAKAENQNNNPDGNN